MLNTEIITKIWQNFTIESTTSGNHFMIYHNATNHTSLGALVSETLFLNDPISSLDILTAAASATTTLHNRLKLQEIDAFNS